MARKRDFAAEYRRRTAGTKPGAERSRARGHAPGEYRRRTAGASSSEERARRAGHRGRADFLRYIRPGDTVTLAVRVQRIRRDRRGRFTLVKTVIPAREGRKDRDFTIRNQTDVSLRKLIREEIARGALLTPFPSYDQRQLLRKPVAADIRLAKYPMSDRGPSTERRSHKGRARGAKRSPSTRRKR